MIMTRLPYPTACIILLLAVLLSAVPAYAQFDVEISIVIGVEPQVRAVFNESVILKNATIAKLAGMSPPLILQTIGTTKEPAEAVVATYLITPTRALTNGNYLIQLVASDRVDNELTFVKPFLIDFPVTDIRIISPPLGATNVSSFDLTIQTIREGNPRLSDCKYASFDPRENFEVVGLRPFDDPAPGVRSAVHTISNFSSKAGLVPNVPSPGFYVICIDDLGRANQKRISAMIDTISPAIESISLDPPRIIEYPIGGGAFSTDATIRASEPVICKYTINESRPFREMTPFDSYDEEDTDAFASSVAQRITLPEEDLRTYTLHIICRDKSGQQSQEATKDIQVDLSAAIGISVLSPPPFSTGQALNLTVTTEKTSSCDLIGPDGRTVQLTSEANPAKFHAANLGTLNEGAYTLQITCRSGQAGFFQEQTVSHQFTVDKSPPSAPAINGSTVSCAANPMAFTPAITFSATDVQSGIREFRYSVTQLGINQTGSSITQLSGRAANMSNSTTSTFSLSVVAVNNAGLIGMPTATSISVNPSHPLCLEKNPPRVTVREERQTGNTRVTLLCEDDTGCDNSTFLYGMADNQSCSPFTAYTTQFSVFRTQTICYSVRDRVGNNASGSSRVTVTSATTCGNGVKDGEETDIDCGGSCGSTCTTGKACEANNDCTDLFCSEGRCRTPTCTDNALNNRETDVDCGGPSCTQKCDINRTCAQSTDCRSGFCDPTARTCAISTCTDGIRGGNETDVDCGGGCTACEENQRCSLDTDCSTNKCEFGFCKREVIPTTETPKPIEKTFGQKLGSFLASWGLIVLGLICIVGGTGYLEYKSAHPARAMPMMPSRQPTPTRPLTREELERHRMEEERRKKLAETIRQRVEHQEEERKEQRSKLFGAFGAGKPATEKTPERIALPSAAAKPGKEEWISLEKLGEKTKGVTTAGTAKAKPAPEAEEFSRLGKIGTPEKTEEDVFARLPSGGGARQPEEDVFARLPSREGKGDGKGEGYDKGEVDHDLLRRAGEHVEREAATPSQKTKPGRRTQAKRRR